MRRSNSLAIEKPMVQIEQARGKVTGEPQASGGAHPALRFLFSRIARVVNPLLLARAGSRRLPAFAVIHHRGRRSGRVYTTPVGARKTPDGFVIPMTFGEQADWFRNVQAAGGCVITWNGAEYTMVEPEVMDWASARSAYYPLERALLPVFGVKQFVRLRHAPAGSTERS